MDKNIDHEGTKNIVCPYCGHEDLDSWEVRPNEEDIGIVECGYCEEKFVATRVITIYYNTSKEE